MLRRPLSEAEARLLADERRALARFAAVLERTDVAQADRTTLAESVAQLDEAFLLVVVGEFNAGKSALINALVGAAILDEGVTPTTDKVGILRHGEVRARRPLGPGLEEIVAPVELLREIAVVDTPGTNAVLREHERLAREFVPRADLVLFVTSADRPFTETERAFLETVRGWGKSVLAVVNKKDILERPEDVERVVGFVAEQAERPLGVRPEVFAVSARQALRATAAGGDRSGSGLPTLERHVAGVLEDQERFRLKLLNPLGVAQRLADVQAEVAAARLALIRDDLEVVEQIDEQMLVYREDLRRDFRYRLADVDNVLLDFVGRGEEFFDRTLRLGRLFDLMNEARIKGEFDREVVGDLPRAVESRADEVIEWMVVSELKQWQVISERLARRHAAHGERLAGHVSGAFEQDRRKRLEDARREAQRALESYDRDEESSRLAGAVRDSVAGAALLQAGALGLGTVVTLMASTTLADVTGIVAAGALSVLGLLAIPHRKRRARNELRAKVEALRTRLMASLTGAFDRELDRSVSRIEEAMAPYTRFVRGERERLGRWSDELGACREELGAVRARVERPGS